MKGLVEVIAKALVDNPDAVVVEETEKDDSTVIVIKVAESDMGKVIGKQGRIAKALRTVVRAAAIKENKRVIVDILQWFVKWKRGFFAPLLFSIISSVALSF